MTTISDMAKIIVCLKCGHRGKDFTYEETTEDVYLKTPNKMQKISNDNEQHWAYKCPICNGNCVAIYF